MCILSRLVPLWARAKCKKALVCLFTTLENKEFVLSCLVSLGGGGGGGGGGGTETIMRCNVKQIKTKLLFCLMCHVEHCLQLIYTFY